MSWEDQGRQYHGWFGHGTSDQMPEGAKSDEAAAIRGQSLDQRIQAVAHGSTASLPHALRMRRVAEFDSTRLSQLTDAMTAWVRGTKLDNATFADRLLNRGADDPVVAKLRSAALSVALAQSHADLRDAAIRLGEAMQLVGLDRWPGFLAEAQRLAADPVTTALIEKSRQPPVSAKDAIRPVYPVETALGIGGVARAGVAAIARAAGRAALQRLTSGKSASEPRAPAPEPTPSGQPVRLHEGQQGKHIEGSNNFDPTRSTLTVNPQKLLSRFAGRGERNGDTCLSASRVRRRRSTLARR